MATARRASALLTAAVVLGMASFAAAQPVLSERSFSLFGLDVHGEIELSGRFYLSEPPDRDKAKLIEYRDLDTQPFGAFRLRFSRPDETYSVEMGGDKIGQTDQEFFLSAERLGRWKFNFDWDQIPHVYSTSGRTLVIESAPGVLTLPTPRPTLPTYNSGRTLDEIATEWDTARFGFALTPTPSLDLTLDFAWTHKNGDYPIGVAFGSPGNNFFQVAAPVDQNVYDFRIEGSWVGDGWQIQGGYVLSIFQNDENSLVVDNPCFGLGGPLPTRCASDANGAPQRGRLSTAPDNMANTLYVAGAVNVPFWKTRISANAAYSLRIQNDTFLPHTINPALVSPSLILPQSDLNGMVGTFLFNLNATSRPLPPLTLTLHYRLYDFDDMSDEITFPGHVVNDRTLVNEPRTSGQYSYTKQDLEFDARWRFGQPVALTAGFGWERWDRDEHREVSETNEYMLKLALDATPIDWFTGRLLYRPSTRRISDYNTFAHLAHTVVEEPTPDEQAQGQSVLLRKFDEADRDRQRLDLLLAFTPTDKISFTPTFGWRYDDYPNTTLGLQNAEAYSVGFDVGWTPVEWLSLTAGYVYEHIDQQLQSRNREVSGTTTFDFPDFNWVSKIVDTINTVHASAKATLIPQKLLATLDFAYSKSKGEVNDSNPVTPTSGNASQRANATVRNFPDLEDSLLHLEASLRYYFAKSWYMTLSYIFEKYTQTDFRTDGLNPFVPGSTSIWLGDNPSDYTAHIMVMSVGYRF
jgi:MtrB/PioB family decaheme-associated outer membrane protein